MIEKREEYITRLVDVSPVAMVVSSGTDERVILVNRKFTELFGYTIDDMPDVAHWWPLAYPDADYREEIKAQWAEKVERAIKNQSEAEPMEATVSCKDGSRRHVEFRFSSMGEWHLVTFADLTERKREEQILRESEARLKEAQRIAHLGHWELDLVKNTLYWSDEVYRIFGLEPQEFDATYEAFLEHVYPDDRDFVNKAYTDSVRNRTGYDIEHRVFLKSGEVKYVNERCDTEYDDKGNPLRSLGTVLDITERKKAEMEREQYFRFFQTSADLMCIADPNGAFVKTNPACSEQLGYSETELMAKPFIEFVHTDDRQSTLDEMTRQLQKGFSLNFENRYICKDGSLRWLSWRAIYNKDEGITYATARDITEHKRAEQEIQKLNAELEQRVIDRTAELQESQRALMNIVEDLNQKTLELELANNKLKELDQLKSMFIASMSHELRTPLNSIIGFSSILIDEWIGPLNVEQKENLSTVLRSGKHLLALINDVIDVSKVEAGRIDVVMEDFDLHNLISEAVALFKKEIEEKGLNIKVEAVHQAMHSDTRRLFQCVVNLVSNAVKFTERGDISVKTVLQRSKDTEPAPDLVEITVTDTGIGIREEDLPKLFAAFTRIPSPLSMKVKGTGLGLYLVKKISTEILKGDVTVQSAFGEGSSFCLKIPLKLWEGTEDEKSSGGRG